MKRLLPLAVAFTSITAPITSVYAHCQMPCGIYHDDMVFDQIDQYVETMVKCMSILNNNKFSTVHERNEFIRWVQLKEKASDETAELITTFFLQQKIKPGEADTAKRLELAQQMLFSLVAIKQNTDKSMVDDFNDLWEKFKVMFHVEGYECKIETLKQKKPKASEFYEELDNERHNHDTHSHEH